ncbi:HepT-like ribonuclease domain-containing protein [Mariniflexile sp.]|uniref:HepT-like ribonuclease domain-containing protein n=1 Tax=Mariniflexile sp. TaxID=1979402 RepID=UPI004048B55D
MSRRDTILLLEDMLESAQKIKLYTKGLDYNSFLADDKTVDAVVRNFEIIGEAANRIDPDFRERNPEIEWKRLRGFRNRIDHDYFGIDHGIVWSIIENYLDEMIAWLHTKIDSNRGTQS